MPPAGPDVLGLRALLRRLLYGDRRRRCRRCDQPIRWRRSRSGKWIPVNTDGTTHSDAQRNC